MWLFAQSKTVIGLDIGSYAVKAVALQASKDRITLHGYASMRIADQDPATVIKEVIARLGVRSQRVCTALSGRSVIVRQIEAPRLEGEALHQHVLREADKYLPFGSDEVVIDAQPLPDPPGATPERMSVILAAVRRSLIVEHLAQLKPASVEPEVIDVDVFALANCYEVLGPPAPPESEHKAVALIDIGASKSSIAILLGPRLVFTREVYLAGSEISEAIARTMGLGLPEVEALKLSPGEQLDQLLDAAQPAFEDLTNEIRLSLDYVEGQFECEVKDIVLSGGTSLLPNAAQTIGNLVGRPVHVFDPLAGVDLVPSRYDVHSLDALSPSLTVALGLALHLLEPAQRGLGGSQSQAWQPRTAGVAVGPPAPAPAAPPQELAPAAAVPTAPAAAAAAGVGALPPAEPSPVVPPPGTPPVLIPPAQPSALAAPVSPPPPPVVQPPAVASSMGQATVSVAATSEEEEAAETIEAMIAPVSTPQQAMPPPPLPFPQPPAPASPPASPPAVRSGLLVVMDEEQEAPPQLGTERIVRPSTTTTVSARPLTLEPESEDEQKDDEKGGAGMPPLPPLPPLPPR